MLKLRIGTGTMVTVLAALIIGGYGVYQQRKAAAQPPVVERTVQGTRGIVPVPEFILRHQTDLELSATQVTRLRVIATAYRKDITPYQQQIKAASANYQRQMERANTKERLSMREIQSAGSDVQQLTRIVVTTRHAYWQQARAVLTAQQQAQADRLASQVSLKDLL